MIRGSFAAMGTSVDAVVRDHECLAAVRSTFAEVEARCSRFFPGSELSAINRRRRNDVAVSPMMRAILRTAIQLRDLTGGLVDPAVGAHVSRWGYDRTFEEVVDRDQPPRAESVADWDLVGSRLRLDPQVRLDLGGIAKGFTCDRVVDRELASIVNAGGDIRSSHPDAEVELVDPWEAPATMIPLGVGALATSSVTRRRWRVGSEIAHHLIDPRTGAPASSPILSASVVAATAAE
ncbi:MAG: FAD:protein FMN transferase, partial [Acidimicrobiia bacterium]